MPIIKKTYHKKEEKLSPLAYNFLERLIEVQFKKKPLQDPLLIEMYIQCLIDISSQDTENTNHTEYFENLDENGKKIYTSIKLMYKNWENIDKDRGGYIELDKKDIHPSFVAEIQPYNIDFLKSYLTSSEIETILRHFKTNDPLAYVISLLVFSSGIQERDLLGMKFQDFEPKLKGRNNLLSALAFSDSGGNINDKGTSTRIYLLNPFARSKILDTIAKHKTLEESNSSRLFFKGMGKIVNKVYIRELCQRIGGIVGKEVDYKSLRGSHVRSLYENLPCDLVGLSVRVELIHSALIGFGVGLKYIAQALPAKK